MQYVCPLADHSLLLAPVGTVEMCGIAGYLSSDNDDHTRAAILKMIEAQAHRGPDDSGCERIDTGAQPLFFGARRLAILDVSPLGHQPMLNPNTGDVLVYNGEIYNFRSLRAELEGAGYAFRGNSDTEVLLRGYEHWGIDVLDRLRGMFALAIWDARRRVIVLARDHLGIKPLYLWARRNEVLFASEVRALLAARKIPPRVDQDALAGYLAYGAVQEPRSIVENVRMLPAASWLEITSSGEIGEPRTYWDPPRSHDDSAEIDLSLGSTALRTAVRRHLESDVTLGVFLSSGLDSTAVAAIAQQEAASDIRAFTVTFPESPSLDEGPGARETAMRLDLTHEEVPVDGATALTWAQDYLRSMDQPAMDGLNTFMVARAVKDHGITVALSGQGGDELFGGYPSFQAVPRWRNRLRRMEAVPPRLRGVITALAARWIGSVEPEKAGDLASSSSDPLDIYLRYRRTLSGNDLSALGIASNALRSHASDHPFVGAEESNEVDAVRQMELALYLRNMLLRDADVFGMARSLEIRVPLLDRDVVDWALSVPGSALVQENQPNKPVLRMLCSGFFASQQVAQPKRGFTLPLADWLGGPMASIAEQGLETLEGSGTVDPRGIRRITTGFAKGLDPLAWSKMWNLVSLGHWIDLSFG